MSPWDMEHVVKKSSQQEIKESSSPIEEQHLAITI